VKVHVITKANRAHYASELEQMHRLRHQVFVDELKWTALASPSGLEIDNFDDEDAAVYLVACEDGRVYGSLRLLPSWRRCMLKERWPEFVTEGETPTGPNTWEWTRWCPGTLNDRRHLIKARAALIIAALEFARSRSIKTYITFCEVKFVGQLEELGWHPRPLGMPRPFDEGTAIGVEWEVGPDLLAETRKLMRLSGPVSIEAPAADGESFIRPWMLERLLSVTSASDVLAIQDVLGQVAVTPARAFNGTSLHDVAIQGRA
jgi:acyl-homoserine lactone synthase